ncbi:MAG: hypothetical protein ACJAWV_003057 [Flammeovirgaceae bacterium]
MVGDSRIALISYNVKVGVVRFYLSTSPVARLENHIILVTNTATGRPQLAVRIQFWGDETEIEPKI